MRPITPVAVAVGADVTVPGVQGTDGWAVLYNESGLTVIVRTGLGSRTLPAWTGDKFKLHGEAQPGSLEIINAQATLSQSNPPASTITGDLYNDVEGVPSGTFPIALSRQVSVGNPAPLSTSASAIVNDGNTPATQILESTPSDQSVGTHAFNFNNDGSGLLQVLSAGAQRTVLQVTRGNATTGKAAIQLGDPNDTSILTVEGNIANAVAAQTATAVTGGGEFSGSNDAYGFPDKTSDGVEHWRYTTTFGGTGAGTYNHNFQTLSGATGKSPLFVAITSTEANSTQTVGVDSIGNSTVHVNMPNFWPFVGFSART